MSDHILMLMVLAFIGLVSGLTCLIIAATKKDSAAVGWGFAGFVIIIITICGLGVSYEQMVKEQSNSTRPDCGWHHTPLETK